MLTLAVSIVLFAVTGATADGNVQPDLSNTYVVGLDFIHERAQLAKTLSEQQISPRLPGILDVILQIPIQKFQEWVDKKGPNATQCLQDFESFLTALGKMELWALQMVDSYGKMGSGILQGNFAWPGDYNLCLKINGITTVNVSTARTYQTQYCWSRFNLSLDTMLGGVGNSTPIDLYSAICAPETCAPEDLSEIMRFISGLVPIESFLSFVNVTCVPNKLDFRDDGGAVTSVAVCCIFLFLMIIGTLYDIFRQQQRRPSQFDYTTQANSEPNLTSYQVTSVAKTEPSSDLQQEQNQSASSVSLPTTIVKQSSNRSFKQIAEGIIISFSVYTNGSKILSLAPGKESITVLNGIRFFSMTWVILGHTFLQGCSKLDRPAVVLELIDTLAYQIISQGVLAVDTFFLLSGLLVTYLFLKEYERTNGKISWFKFYFHRFWRLTPPYIFILFLFHMRLSKYVSNGPFWPQVGFSGTCETKWWWNLLYINNFVSVTEMCMGWTWYLANDMQFYILSPLILIPMARRSIPISSIVAGSFILVSCICNGVLSSHYGLLIGDSELTNADVTHTTFDAIYSKPYTRIGPYIVGMLCGWFLFACKCKLELKKHWVIAGWLAAAAIALSVVLGTYHVHLNQFVSSLYFALSKIAWSLSICWVIVACATGHGGFVNSFLSWPAWNPLSRLTYTAYLWHYILLVVVLQSVEAPIHFSYTLFILYYISITVVTYIGALILSLAFESPLLALERLLLSR